MHKRTFLLTTLLAACGTTTAVANDSAAVAAGTDSIPSLRGARSWLNSPPLDRAAMRGKVVAFHFWTLTCINWLRTMPWLRAWSARYRGEGFELVGIHTPEFEFERDPEEVRRAVTDMRIDWPVAIDSERTIWRAFDNEYWPALYVADASGRIRLHRFGEGDYDGAESALRNLLRAAGTALPSATGPLEASGAELAADWSRLASAETYLAATTRRSRRSDSAGLSLNQWSLSGDWTRSGDHIRLAGGSGRIAFRFHARDLHLVMGPARGAPAIHYRIRLDGRAPAGDHGADADAEGTGEARERRLYQLVRQSGAVRDRLFEIEFAGAGVEAFAFTFG